MRIASANNATGREIGTATATETEIETVSEKETGRENVHATVGEGAMSTSLIEACEPTRAVPAVEATILMAID
jgi:hypothetical protein